MMTPSLIRAPRRQNTAATQAPRRRSRWDEFFADPAAIESDYHRMARRHEGRPAGAPSARRP